MSTSNIKLEDIILIAIVVLIVVLFIVKHRSGRIGAEDQGEIGVGNLIKRVTEELRKAEGDRRKADHKAIFKVEKFDLEVNFVVKMSDSGEAKFSIEPLTLGGKEEIAREKIQKVILHMSALEPPEYQESAVETKSPKGGKVRVYGERPPDKEGGKQ